MGCRAVLLWACLLLWSAPAAGQWSHGQREHDGIYVRLVAGASAGVGRYREPIDSAPTTVRSRGAGLGLELTAGGKARGSWLLHGSLLWSSLIRSGRDPAEAAQAYPDVTLTGWALAPGVTHYWPSNAFLSASAGLAFITELRARSPVLESKAGAALSVSTGFERWVGKREQWGVGPMLRVTYLDAAGQLARVNSRARMLTLWLAITASWG